MGRRKKERTTFHSVFPSAPNRCSREPTYWSDPITSVGIRILSFCPTHWRMALINGHTFTWYSLYGQVFWFSSPITCSPGSQEQYIQWEIKLECHLSSGKALNAFLRYLYCTPYAVGSQRKLFEKIMDMRQSVLLEATGESC